MLLGDRSFVERDEATDFQKTGAFHVLVVAGLHVGAFALGLFWIGRTLRLPRVWAAGLTLLMLLAYVSVVEQRAPVLRAGLMAAIVVIGGFFFRRLELLNSAAVAALVLLVARPSALRDSSFQLSFLAIGCIGGLAMPWLEGTVQPYARALRGWRDVTRDAAHEPRAAQLQIDLRSVARAIENQLPARISTLPGTLGVGVLGLMFRVWELLVLTLALQVGMLPLLAGEFHRITLSAPLANFCGGATDGADRSRGFLTLIAGGLFPPLRILLAMPLSWLTQGLLHAVAWCAHFQLLSYRYAAPRRPVGLGLAASLLREARVWPPRRSGVAAMQPFPAARNYSSRAPPLRAAIPPRRFWLWGGSRRPGQIPHRGRTCPEKRSLPERLGQMPVMVGTDISPTGGKLSRYADGSLYPLLSPEPALSS